MPPRLPFPPEFEQTMGARPFNAAMLGGMGPAPMMPLPPAQEGEGMGATGPSQMDAMMAGNVALVPNDPTLSQMMVETIDSPPPPPEKVRRKAGKRPDPGNIITYANMDKELWRRRNERMSRDVSIYRQHDAGTPSHFDPENQIQYISAAMSNLVNRLANMMGGIDPTFESPYRDEATEEAAQAIENFAYWCRDYERRLYARGGGNPLQRDEFFFLLLHGAVVSRILPDLQDDDYPWASSLLDPSTCYPTFGSEKEGIVRMTRMYQEPVAKIVGTYGMFDSGLELKLMQHFGAIPESYGEFLNQKVDIIEYWDRDYRAVLTTDGIEIMSPRKHDYGFVPFIYITAVGEPKSMQTPEGRYIYNTGGFGTMWQNVSQAEDLAEKGVSVLHYLINTNRLREAMMTLFYAEVEKASRPPTMRYRAPQLMGDDVPTIDYDAGGANAAWLGLEKVEGLPTSPHPTDVAPLMQSLDSDWYGGALNPANQGQEMGANASGYALDTLIAAAKELILPYLQAFENYLMLKMEMKLRFYKDLIGPMIPLKVPMKSLYGSASGMQDLSLEAIEAVGVQINARMENITDANLPQRIATAERAMKAGIWGQRAGMSYSGVKNPNKMFAEIRSEQALQHPLIRDLFAIPQGLEEWGASDLAEIWGQIVGTQALMAAGLGGPQPGQPGQGGGAPPPEMGGQTNAGREQQLGSPGGPQPGQGRTS